MGGMKKIGKNSPRSNIHMGGHYVPPPTLICNSDDPPSWGLTECQRAIHEGRKYSCRECDHQSTTKSSFNKHLSNRHFWDVIKRSKTSTVIDILPLLKQSQFLIHEAMLFQLVIIIYFIYPKQHYIRQFIWPEDDNKDKEHVVVKDLMWRQAVNNIFLNSVV